MNPNDDMAAFDAWDEHLTQHLTFPFEAEVGEFQERGPLQAGDRVHVLRISTLEDLHGILVRVRARRGEYDFSEARPVSAHDDRKNAALEELQQMLEEAASAGANSIELEYVAEGLEVMYVFGSTGNGYVIDDRVLASGIIRLIVERARLARKSRGVMSWTLFRKQYNITVEEYDSFGESAFRLILGKPGQKRS